MIKLEKGDINDEKRDFREEDEVDKFLNQEGKKTDENDDEEIAVDEINIWKSTRQEKLVMQ